jgi:FKBP-type peptidyl-prolyl cis-trans isomerase FkpA
MSRIAAVAVAFFAFTALAGEPPKGPPPGHGGMPPGQAAAPAAPLNPADTKKVLYALGMSLGKNLNSFSLTPAELAEVQKGLSDQVLNKPAAVKLEEWGPKIQELFKERQAARGKAELEKGEAYLTKMAKEKGAVKTPSGLIYIETAAGSGPSPAATDTVKVHYRGTLIEGKEFDSSYKRNEPIEFPLSGVIPCWTEGVQKMKVGGKARLICPSKIAYGERGAGADIPPNATLTFEVELIAIKPPAPPQPAPGGSQGFQPR